jgi:hypothetical protein
MWRKKQDFVIKIKIPLLGTASPTRLGIANTYPPNGEIIKRTKVRHPSMSQSPSRLLVLPVIPSRIFFKKII